MDQDNDFVRMRTASYGRHLRDDVLSWWLDKAVDREFGGVFTFWGDNSMTLLSTDKYVWSQGRWIWTLTSLVRLVRRGGLDGIDVDELLQLAERSAVFLRDSAILPDGTAANFVTREGIPTVGFTGDALHASVYADLFVALGFAGLARELTTGDWGERAERILVNAAARINDGTALTEPYPVPEGFAGFGPQMILINTATEVWRATRSVASAEIALAAVANLRDEFFQGGPDSAELRPVVAGLDETLGARHRNPGHILEALWFIQDAVETLPGAEQRLGPDIAGWLVDALDFQCERAWDDDFSGLYRFVDVDGGKPRGRSHDTRYEKAVLESWDDKLWWPHNEALYCALLLWKRTGDRRAMEWFRRIDFYTFAAFPAGPGAEWNQILTRQGVPAEPNPAALLPVKDPYHLMRSLILLVELNDGLDSPHSERKKA